MTREQFFDQVFKIVPQKFPLVKLARGEEPFSLKVNDHLVSLENLYRMAVLDPGEMRRHVERWMVELLRVAEGTPDRGGSFDSIKDRILPMILPSDWGGDAPDKMATQPLVGDLHIAYAIDSDRTITYVPRSQFSQWNVTADELHDTALENLINRSETMVASAAQDDDGQISLILFQTGDGYDSSRLLLPTLYDRLREHLGSPFAAAIPTRDLLLCFRADEETIARVRAQVADDFKNMPHQVTDRLLLVTADGIAVLADEAM